MVLASGNRPITIDAHHHLLQRRSGRSLENGSIIGGIKDRSSGRTDQRMCLAIVGDLISLEATRFFIGNKFPTWQVDQHAFLVIRRIDEIRRGIECHV